MKSLLLILILFGAYYVMAQDDSLRILELDEQIISYKREIAFKDHKFYITDFHINEKGRFVLLKRFSEYMVQSLDEQMATKSTLKLSCKPQRLYYDCLGFLYVMTKDSIHQIEELSNGSLVIWESNPIAFYNTFLKDCVASNSQGMIYQRKLNLNKTTAYYQQLREKHTSKRIYVVEDSVERKNTLRQYKELPDADFSSNYRMKEIDVIALKSVRDVYEETQFFQRHAMRTSYNPLFCKNDTSYIFDHLNDRLVVLSDTGKFIRQDSITYHTSKTWDNRMLFDTKRNQFYAIEMKGGISTICLLSSTTFKVIRRVKIEDHIYIDKIFIYGGYAYYLYKKEMEDNLNKLFRQRII